MSLKLKKLTLHFAIAGCMSMAFYAQADVKIGVAGPFTGRMRLMAPSTGKGPRKRRRILMRREELKAKNCAGSGGRCL